MTTGDVDGDGHLDLVVAHAQPNAEGSRVTLLRGGRDGLSGEEDRRQEVSLKEEVVTLLAGPSAQEMPSIPTGAARVRAARWG